MSKNTRIATSIVARYPENIKVKDSYYLDGRVRQAWENDVEIILDREDRGFFYALYSSAQVQSHDESRLENSRRASLDRVMNDMKNDPNKDIDKEINELADAAVNVAGRLTLDEDESHQPYFAGLMVRDAEIAAVTLGRGCAYLYRQDILYPLTDDDLPLEPIDTNGVAVPNFNIYKAGSAATIRYSNIGQLETNDCIILCSKEVMQCINQREMLQILFEVEDASEAAARVKNLCAERIPEQSVQFLIGFVEDILATDKELRSISKTGYQTVVKDTTGAVPTIASLPQDRNHAGHGDEYDQAQVYGQRFNEEMEESRGGTKALLIVLSLILLILLGLVIAHYFGFDRKIMDKFFPTTTTTQTTTTEPTTVPTTTPAPTTTPTTTTEPTTEATTKPELRKYVIQEGDLLYNIIQSQYESYNLSEEQIEVMMKKVIEANPEVFKGEDGSDYAAGEEIVLPDPEF